MSIRFLFAVSAYVLLLSQEAHGENIKKLFSPAIKDSGPLAKKLEGTQETFYFINALHGQNWEYRLLRPEELDMLEWNVLLIKNGRYEGSDQLAIPGLSVGKVIGSETLIFGLTPDGNNPIYIVNWESPKKLEILCGELDELSESVRRQGQIQKLNADFLRRLHENQPGDIWVSKIEVRLGPAPTGNWKLEHKIQFLFLVLVITCALLGCLKGRRSNT